MPFKSIADGAWAAGLFEGEGTVVRHSRYTGRDGIRRGRRTPQITLRVTMTDPEPIRKFAAMSGGSINGPYHDGNPKHKHTWMVTVSGPCALNTVDNMWDHLSERRKRQLEVAYAVREPEAKTIPTRQAS